jgi:death on curing protein
LRAQNIIADEFLSCRKVTIAASRFFASRHTGGEYRGVTRFLGVEEVMGMHDAGVERHGGSLGLRDLGLLESAVAVPAATFAGEYLHSFPWEMAAAYLFHIIQNHAFVDGNKRAGSAAALVFLDVNGFDTAAIDEDLMIALSVDVANGAATKSEAAELLRFFFEGD